MGKVNISKKSNENPCKSGSCGICKVKNPLNTDTKGRTGLSIAIAHSPSFQKGFIRRYGRKEGIKKLKCEFERVKNTAIKEYGINVKTKFKIKV